MIDTTEERLKPDKTRRYMDDCLEYGQVMTNGTVIDDLMPPVSRFGRGGGDRSALKARIIERIKLYFEKFAGLVSGNFEEE